MKFTGIDNVRCLIDLHNHLEGALSIDTFRHLAEMDGVKLPEDPKELEEQIMAPEDCKDLNEFLTKFDLAESLLQTSEAIEFAVYNTLREMHENGVAYAELRYGPMFNMERGLTQEESLQAAIRGLKKAPIPAGLIICAMRGEESIHELNMETIRLAKKYLGQGVVSTDIAGAEALYPTADYEEEFRLAKELGVPYTIHAGEADGPESVRKALEFGAQRIGHGVRALEDPEVAAMVAEKKIPLEICVTSNIITSIFDKISDYPFRKMMDMGIVVTVNSDDPTVCRTDIRKEWERNIEAFDLTAEEVKMLLMNSANAAFCDEETKAGLRAKIEEAFA